MVLWFAREPCRPGAACLRLQLDLDVYACWQVKLGQCVCSLESCVRVVDESLMSPLFKLLSGVFVLVYGSQDSNDFFFCNSLILFLLIILYCFRYACTRGSYCPVFQRARWLPALGRAFRLLCTRCRVFLYFAHTAKNRRIPPPSSSEDMLGGNYLIAQQLPASSPFFTSYYSIYYPRFFFKRKFGFFHIF